MDSFMDQLVFLSRTTKKNKPKLVHHTNLCAVAVSTRIFAYNGCRLAHKACRKEINPHLVESKSI